MLLWALGGPLFFYASRYCKNTKSKVRVLFIALVCFFVFSDAPLFGLDVAIYYYYGQQSIVQMSSFILRLMSFFVNGTAVWFLWINRASKYLQERYDTKESRAIIAQYHQQQRDRAERGLKTAENFLSHTH
jgi:hypothetical protein